jgi:hypothetical protein
MKFYYLLSLIIGFVLLLVIASQDLEHNLVNTNQLLITDQNETSNKSYALVEGAVYNGECANIDEIINNYMTDYQLEKTGKREGYNECLLRNGVVKLSTFSTNQENDLNNDKLMKIYAADLFRLALQTAHGRKTLRQLFSGNPDLVEFYKEFYQNVMPDFDNKIAKIIG